MNLETLIVESLAACQALSLLGLGVAWIVRAWLQQRPSGCGVPHCLPGRGAQHNFQFSSSEETNKQQRRIYVCQQCDAREIRVLNEKTGKEVLSGYA